MPNPMEKATAYLSKLEADRMAAITMSKEKAQEAMLIKARQEGFREAMAIFGVKSTSDNKEIKTYAPHREKRRDIGQMIMNELSFSGKAMTTQQITKVINYIPDRTDVALKRLESAGKIIRNRDGHWEVVVITVPEPNAHRVAA
jgi:hypothetical protein